VTRTIITVEAILVTTTLFTLLGHAGWLGYRGSDCRHLQASTR
jgi:hypothetical protein